MKLIKFTAFLFYRYYSEGKWASSIPYFRTIATMTLLGYIHLLQILIILNKVDLIGLSSTDNKGIRKIIIFLIMLPIFLLLTTSIKKEELEKMREKYAYSWNKIFNWNAWLIIYIILSFATLILLAILVR